MVEIVGTLRYLKEKIMNSEWIGEEYWVDPMNVKFDNIISTFNERHTPAEYEATMINIRDNGQSEPIQINSDNELCEDGVHRVKIAKELIRKVLCRKIDGSLPVAKRLAMANRNSTSGRSYNNAQKAVKALRYAILSGITTDLASKMFNVQRKITSAAATIKGLGLDSVLDEVMKTGGYKIDGIGRPIQDLKRIASHLKAENSREENRDEDKSNEPHIDYNELINTDSGRRWFWMKR